MSSVLGSAVLGAYTFCARQHGQEECDSKGLPLTPNSVNIAGRFQSLLELDHGGLCAYLDIKRIRNERLLVVSEWYEDSVEKHIESGKTNDVDSLRRLARQVLEALAYLNHHNMVHHCLAPDTILFTPTGDVKLHNYGLYHMTDCGRAVRFPIGDPRHLAPETIMKSSPSLSTKVDVWSLGIILLELYLGTVLYPDLCITSSLSPLFKRIMLLVQNFHSKGEHPLTGLLEMQKHKTKEETMPSNLKSFLEACLSPLPSERPTPVELLSHPFLADIPNGRIKKNGVNFSFLPSPFKQLHRCVDLNFDLPAATNAPPPQSHTVSNDDDHLAERRKREVYYLWSLAGGEVEAELRKNSLIPSTPPICSLPCVVTTDREEHGSGSGRVSHYDRAVLPLSLDQLRKRLEGMSVADYYPLTETSSVGSGTVSGQERHDSSSLPLAIKEKGVEYQFHRVVMFTRLLESYPHSRSLIMAEAVVDVCPLVRAEVWAALLGVKGDIQEQYASIDKDTEQATDRQIDVDIPRCHQYDTLLASHQGHSKFKRILKAWIFSQPSLVYWQGLDSLCAPFLALNFNNEALALACLSAFISKYLHNFFLKDNSAIMQEYLAVFSQMIAFHEPALFNHLDSIAFNPELYAIPWFLTMFTHILPLHKIYYLWDTLLLGNCSFPFFVGVSILQHLKDDLLTFDFNECILMFSDMPDIDIQACIHDAVRAYLATPPSTYLRKHNHTYSPPTDVPPEALRDPLPLDVLRQESCPRISAHDVIALCGLEYHALGYGGGARDSIPAHSLRSPTSPLLRRAETTGRKGKSGKGGRKGRKGVLVDIRSQEEFRAGHVPSSLSLPHQLAFQPDGSLAPSLPSSSLSSVRTSRVIIVIANKGKSGPEFGRQLVRLRFPHVCVLHNGAAVLRSLGLLTALGEDP